MATATADDIKTATIEMGMITKVTVITRSNPVEGNKEQATPAGIASKSFSWKPLHYGDCEQDGGILTINSDGSATFTCSTLTYHTHSGDVWHASFTALDQNGAAYFTTPTFNSPRMNDGNPPPHYMWTAHFTFPAYDYSGIRSFTQHYSC